ncbi:MAG: HTH domain-containing protein [Agriterribacter sp.]
MNNLTIKESIKKVLIGSKEGLTVKEIYDRIMEKNLFEFKAKNPIAVLSAELRKSCQGINVKRARQEKLFILKDGNKYALLS